MSKTTELRLIDANAFSEMLEARANMAVGMVKSVFYSAKKMVDAMPTVVVMQTLSLNALRDEVYQDAVAHGLWDGYTIPWECAEMIRNEVDELLCESCDSTNWEDDGTAFAEELADVIIAALSVAGKLGIDIDAAVRRKMEINRARSWKHGKEDNA